MRNCYCLLCLLWLLACSYPTNVVNNPTLVQKNVVERVEFQLSQTIKLTTMDGLTLEGTYYPPRDSSFPAEGLLLLHEAYGDSRGWAGFAATAQERGYALLALDLRGHGGSQGEKSFGPTMDQDVETALAWLKDEPEVDANRLGIAGASLGANLALRAGARHPEIQSVILLSPGISLWKLDINESVVDYGSRPLLLVAAEEDAYPADSVQRLDEKALGYHQLQLYSGSEHGTEMLAAHTDLPLLILDWFEETIR